MPKTCRTHEWERWCCGKILSGEESPALHRELRKAAEHGNCWGAAQQHEEATVLSSPLSACATPPAQTPFLHARQEPNESEFKNETVALLSALEHWGWECSDPVPGTQHVTRTLG